MFAPRTQDRLTEVLKELPPEKASALIGLLTDMFQESVQTSLPQALEQLGYVQEVAGMVHLLAARSNDSKEEVLRKAVTLYGLALDEREKGNRLAVLSPDDEILHEVVGFEPAREAVAQTVG